MQFCIPILAALIVLHPFFMSHRHLMVAPTIEHYGDWAKWGKHSVVVDGQRGDASSTGPTAITVTVSKDSSLDPSRVVYPILAVLWLIVCWSVQRVHAVSGVTRALVRSLGTVVHEEQAADSRGLSATLGRGPAGGPGGSSPGTDSGADSGPKGGKSGGEEGEDLRVVRLLESYVATRDDKVSPNVPAEVPVVLPVFGGVNIVLGGGADGGGAARQ